ncbi:MAG: rhomboid family intramembrane serine protease [Cryomorphaceae bacterium]
MPTRSSKKTETSSNLIPANDTRKLNGTAIAVPLLLVTIMWAVFLIEYEIGANFAEYGLKPRTATGLRGILTIPFIHGSWSHLINNSFPMLVLGWALFHFYRSIAVKTIIGILLLSGIWLWISGRSSFHIGASGVVYGLAFFLFVSGWLRREKRVAALSLLVAFLYGGLWWGVLPVDPKISWEGHFWGALAGIALAVLYRKQGPQKPVYQWELEEEDENIEPYWDPENKTAQSENELSRQNDNLKVTYTIVPSKKKDDKSKPKSN